jgi:ribosomal protein S27AE
MTKRLAPTGARKSASRAEARHSVVRCPKNRTLGPIKRGVAHRGQQVVQDGTAPEMAVKHPRWQCPRCGQVIFWFGATSHKNRCTIGDEPWRKKLEKGMIDKPVINGAAG